MTPTRTVATARRVVAAAAARPPNRRADPGRALCADGAAGVDAAPTQRFDQYGAPLLGIFPLIVMFLTTSVATLRERESGTLERLLVDAHRQG